MGPFATESREKASSRTARSPASVKKHCDRGFTSLQAMQPPTSNSRNWRKRVVRSALHFEVPSDMGLRTMRLSLRARKLTLNALGRAALNYEVSANPSQVDQIEGAKAAAGPVRGSGRYRKPAPRWREEESRPRAASSRISSYDYLRALRIASFTSPAAL